MMMSPSKSFIPELNPRHYNVIQTNWTNNKWAPPTPTPTPPAPPRHSWHIYSNENEKYNILIFIWISLFRSYIFMSDLLLLRYTQHKNYLNYAEKETGKTTTTTTRKRRRNSKGKANKSEINEIVNNVNVSFRSQQWRNNAGFHACSLVKELYMFTPKSLE